ncbi:MAG: AAA family ATPase, partial [Promethearchaeota archaeon]
MTSYIKRIEFQGFKSFGDQKVEIELDRGFTCIVGPNGSGKSNIVDGLCFALGRLSKKTMRAKDLKDLIFVGTKTKKSAEKAIVTVVFDNSENVFPGYSGQDLIISREINQKGKGTYRINGKRTTRDNILMQLSLAGIDPDGFNFILQGKIVELTHMSTEDRRFFIEDLVGLQKFDEEKAAALKELEKADQDLVKFEAIFQEVAKQLREVEKERNDALRWKALDDKIKELNARLIALNIKKLRDEEEQLLVFIDETKKKVEEISENIDRCRQDIEKENAMIETLTTEITNLEEDRNDLELKISNLRSELSSKNTELKIFRENLNKLEERKSKLESMQEEIESGQTYDDWLSEITEDIENINIQITKTRNEIQDKENQEKKLENEITIVQQELDALNKRLNKFSMQKTSLQTELDFTKKNLVKLDKKKGELENELSKLIQDKDQDIDTAIAQAEKEIEVVTSDIDSIKGELKKETQKQKLLETEINQHRTNIANLNNKISDIKSKISVARSEQEMFDKEIHRLKREMQNAEVNKIRFEKDIEKYSGELQKINEQIAIKQKLINDIRNERNIIEKKIDESQKEYEGIEEEVFGILNNLEIMTDNAASVIQQLKSDSKNQGLTAIESSILQFRDYIEDLLELIRTLKDVSSDGNMQNISHA